MANTYAPFGFRQFGQREGSAPTAGMERLLLASSDTNLYFTGDLVSVSSLSLIPGYIAPISSVAANYTVVPIAGVFLGCEYYNPSVARTVWSPYFSGNVGSSSPCNAYVCTNPEQLYIAQGSTGAVYGTSCIGFGIGTTTTGSSLGNTLSGISVMALSTQVSGLSSASAFRVVDVYANYAPPGQNGTSSGSEGAQILVVQPVQFSRRNLTPTST
jgi:hypothetical protein